MHKPNNRINAMNPIESAACISLIQELASTSDFKPRFDSETNEWEVYVVLTRKGDAKGFCNSQLLTALSDAVDWVRSVDNRPSLEDEAKELERRSEPRVQLVEHGRTACCVGCGSKKPLRFEVPRILRITWDTGFIQPDPYDVLPMKANPGQLATCPDCGMTYKLNQ